MGQVLRLADVKRRQPLVFFDRRELSKLLNLYSRRVISGEWRDYAIDHDGRRVVFSIFRNTSETPAYSIMKESSHARGSAKYVVTRGWRQLVRTRTIDEAVTAVERELRAIGGIANA